MSWFKDSRWWGSNLEVVETRPPEEGSNIDLIKEALEPGIVIAVTGDGTQNDVFNALVEADKEGRVSADEVALIPGPAGNGNDFSRSLYGSNIFRNHGRALWELLDRGQPTWIGGMELETPEIERFVHSYVGWGFTAQAADAINRPHYRERRVAVGPFGRLLDIKEVVKTMLVDRDKFEYENGQGPREAQEMIFSLMPRVAGGTIRFATDPLDGNMVKLEMGPRGFVRQAAAKLGAGALSAGIKAEVAADEHEFDFSAPTAMQYDGEPTEVQGKAKLSHHRKLVRAWI